MNYVICQSPKYLMVSINKYKATTNCKLVIREVKGIYDFLIEYKIVTPEDLIFLPVYRRKSILGLFANFIAIKKFCYKYGSDVDNIYVCTNEYDFTTISIINTLANCEVYFEEFYTDGVELFNFNSLINKCLFGVKLHYTDNAEAYLPINESRIKIRSWISGEKSKLNKLVLLEPLKVHAKQLLIIDSNDQSNSNLFSVEKIYYDLIRFCKDNNIQVIIKGHPRLGLSKCLHNLKDSIYIQSTIPLEFIDIDNIDYICGFYSSALFDTSFNTKAKSLLMLCASKHETYYKNYLISNGFNEKNFVLKIEDVIGSIGNIK